jgi:uncharacterized membrane protein (UPF0127 family)
MIASLAACQPSASNAVEVSQSPAGLAQVPLTVTSSTGKHRFTVEVAKTSEQQAMGLMYRVKLAPDRGMIFPFDPPRVASFYMRNTLIPLDMIFVRPDGSIESIAANTIPYSEESVLSEEPVAAVLEIAGGRAAELGIKPGDTVEWSSPR